MLAAERVKQDAVTPEALRGMSFCDFFAAHADGGVEATEQVLIFDQFEEVLTTDPNDTAGKEAFFEGLGQLLKYPGFHALFSIRDEFVGALEPYRKLIPRGFETRYRLDLLGQHEAVKAIIGPTEETPAPITPDAAGVLVGELCKTKVRRSGKLVDEPGPFVEPVQLQVVCYRLWENHHAAGPIGVDLVRGEAGDVDSALADFYAEGVAAVQAKIPCLPERRIRDWCQQCLITSQGTRGQVQEGVETDPRLPPQAIDALIEARIVRALERRGLKWYELAHDRLIEPVRASNAAWRESHLPSQRSLVVSPLIRGLDLCQQNNITEGMHWLVRGLEQSQTPSGRADRLEPLIREEITAWSLEIPRFKAIFPSNGIVFAVAFSPDGQTALTGSADNTAHLWDVTTGSAQGPGIEARARRLRRGVQPRRPDRADGQC